jgi:hypothetical protein
VDPLRLVQLVGVLLMGVGLVPQLTRRTPSRLWRSVGGLGGLVAAGSSAFALASTPGASWSDPAVISGLLIGIGAPFLIAALLMAAHGRR